MHDIVINTGPLIALTAAMESLKFLTQLYGSILVPFEVVQELKAGGEHSAELLAIKSCSIFDCTHKPITLHTLLSSQLDLGEASVIQNALLHGVSLVAIDEKLGRRIARLNQLTVTGSIEILIKAVKAGLISDLNVCFEKMHKKDIWISEALKQKAFDEVHNDNK